jgi:hypothetical protein
MGRLPEGEENCGNDLPAVITRIGGFSGFRAVAISFCTGFFRPLFQSGMRADFSTCSTPGIEALF